MATQNNFYNKYLQNSYYSVEEVKEIVNVEFCFSQKYLLNVPKEIVEKVLELYDAGGDEQFTKEEVIKQTAILNSSTYKVEEDKIIVDLKGKIVEIYKEESGLALYKIFYN